MLDKIIYWVGMSTCVIGTLGIVLFFYLWTLDQTIKFFRLNTAIFQAYLQYQDNKRAKASR